MKSFVFYTAEGYTESPFGEQVENYQILGFEKGNTQEEALQKLLKNDWIERLGFKRAEIIAQQLVALI